jgi:cellulose synthase/poly-beta-1,6-N-acetylglucosamine synthase-like glycosyltransferase
MFIAPEGVAAALAAIMTVPFLCVVLVRLAALREAFASRLERVASALEDTDTRDADLPSYSVLVPLYREANVLPGLVDALSQLDYPQDRLDVILILERDDIDTRRAAELIELEPYMRVVLVPPGEPRTKPRALNYALQLARGELVVIYDAEDIPEPDQLRRAAAMFRAAGPSLACVQCCLNIDNTQAGWLASQFAIEYTALFDAILPSLHRLRFPIPLGGTSNHFPAALLRAIGAWDPHNVTEDADLGIRLARGRLETRILFSTTWEEAPVRLGSWFRQRTRWLKGWMQTYLVHSRKPGRLRADLGAWRYRGFQILMTGMILSVLLHPLFYVLLIYEMATGRLFANADTFVGLGLLALAGFNLVAGYGSSILLGTVSVWRRGWPLLALQSLAMPVYWLLISAAGYRALLQLFTRPHYWEKTEHGQSRRPVRVRPDAARND